MQIQEGLGEFGLFSVMPPFFLVSLSLLSISFLLNLKTRERSNKLFFCQIILLILFLNLTPIIVEGTARFNTSYQNYRAVSYILQTGHIDPLVQWIHNWPSFSILFSIFMEITILPETILLSIYPTLFSIALFFPLFMLFRSVLNDNWLVWIALWTFYISNWIGQEYFSMQSLGLLAFVLILAIVFKLTDSQISARKIAVLLLLFFYVVTSHMLSSLMVVAVFLSLFTSMHPKKPVFAAYFVLIFAAWTVFGAAEYFESNLGAFVAEVFDLQLILRANLTSRISGSAAHVTVTQVSLFFSFAISILALSGLVLVWKKKKMRRTDRKFLLTLTGLFSLIGLASYGGEIFLRVFLFGLIPLSYFVARASYNKVFLGVLAVFLVVAAPSLNIVAHYGNEVTQYVPPSELEGIEFFYKETTHGYVITSYLVGSNSLYRDFRYRESYQYFELSSTEWKNNMLSAVSIEREQPKFVFITYGMREFYDFLLGDPQFLAEIGRNLSESTYYDKFYSNPSFESYVELQP